MKVATDATLAARRILSTSAATTFAATSASADRQPSDTTQGVQITASEGADWQAD